MPQLSFPRQNARTQRFTLGAPRSFTVTHDGRVLFVRSRGGTDPVGCLWESTAGGERLLVDPAALLGGDAEDLPAAERARRERLRESAGGITGYATDRSGATAAFALSGRLFVASTTDVDAREVPTDGGVVGPVPSPDGRLVAYASGDRLHVVDAATGASRLVLADDDPEVSWGSAEFVAAEEMGRLRGFWWSPDSTGLLVARVDTSPVTRWWIADPASPASRPAGVRYPAAGTANADVTLHLVGLDGTSRDVTWNRVRFPYLAEVAWTEAHDALVLVQSRDQRTTAVLSVGPAGDVAVVREDTDPVWLELVPGLPRWRGDGALVHALEDAATSTRRLAVDGVPVTPPGLHLRRVVSVGRDVVFTASDDDPTSTHVYRYDGAVTRVSQGDGVHGAVGDDEVLVLVTATVDRPGSVARVLPGGRVVASSAETPVLRATPRLHAIGVGRLPTALLLPPGDGPFPVLLDPYGGPHAQRVVRSQNAFLSSQWFVEQGFAVVIADGRGTPGQGLAREKAVSGDLAGPVLEDQIEALQQLAAVTPALDLRRVAIRGWSFGGYLAALAVLRRPDVFVAAIAGAPVTDWRLYDTHYTERYLGVDTAADSYERSSLLPDAPRLRRPLLLIHGLADDNVVAAHTLRLSSALLAAGRPHEVLPLSGVTHMASQEEVAENLLLLQLDFLRRALDRTAGDA